MLQKVKLTRSFWISQNVRDKSIGMQTKGLRAAFASSPSASGPTASAGADRQPWLASTPRDTYDYILMAVRSVAAPDCEVHIMFTS